MSFEPIAYPDSAGPLSPDMLYPEAAAAWLEARTFKPAESQLRRYRSSPRYIQDTTLTNYKRYVRSLELFFGRKRLSEITVEHFHEYQHLRCLGLEPFIRSRRPQEEPKSCPTKPNHVNQELCILKAIMRRAGAWTPHLDENYEELHEDPQEIPRALTVEEEQRWLDTSASCERWWLVHWYSIIAFATCMGTNEIRSLRLGDISLTNRVVTVPIEGSKNSHRHRTIPLLGRQALWAMENLLKRAAKLGSVEPDHYLLPFCRGHIFYPDRPMSSSGLKKPWLEIKKAANLPKFRMYDTRHTAITRLSETGTPLSVVMSMAGHLSIKMTQHYTHVSDQAKGMAIEQAQNLRRGVRPEFVPVVHHEPIRPTYTNQTEMNADFRNWLATKAAGPRAASLSAQPQQTPGIPTSTEKPASPFSTFITTIGHTFQRW